MYPLSTEHYARHWRNNNEKDGKYSSEEFLMQHEIWHPGKEKGIKHQKWKPYPIFEESFCIHPCWDPKGLATQQALLLLFGSPKELVFPTKAKGNKMKLKYIQKATYLEIHTLRSKTSKNHPISPPQVSTSDKWRTKAPFQSLLFQHKTAERAEASESDTSRF